MKIKKIKSNKVTEKEVRNLVKKFLKSHIKGVSNFSKIEVKVVELNPPRIFIELPFYSEGNLIRVNEVDFVISEIEKSGILVEIFYLDDLLEYKEGCHYV